VPCRSLQAEQQPAFHDSPALLQLGLPVPRVRDPATPVLYSSERFNHSTTSRQPTRQAAGQQVNVVVRAAESSAAGQAGQPPHVRLAVGTLHSLLPRLQVWLAGQRAGDNAQHSLHHAHRAAAGSSHAQSAEQQQLGSCARLGCIRVLDKAVQLLLSSR
jgi:hypothetical protein